MNQGTCAMKRKAWLCWVIAVSYVILIFGFQTGYAVTNPRMAESLALTPSDIGLIGATYTFFFAFFQIFSGSILDHIGIRPTLALACAFLTGGIFCFAFSGSVAGFVGAQILVALGGSFGFIGAGFTGGLWFPREKYGAMFSWVQFVASVSACLIQLIFIKMLENLPWDGVLTGFGVAGLLLLAIMWFWLDNPPDFKSERLNMTTARTLFRDCTHELWLILKQSEVRFIMLTGAVSFGVMLCISIVWGGYLLRHYSIDAEYAHFAVAMSWLGLAIGSPVFSWLGQKLQNDIRAFGWGLAGQLAILAILVLLPVRTPVIAAILLFLFGFFTGTSMLPFAIAASFVDAQHTGTSAALVNGSQFLAGALLVSIPGYMLNGFSHLPINQVLYLLPIVMLITVIFYFRWSRKYR